MNSMKTQFFVIKGDRCDAYNFGDDENADPADDLKGTLSYGNFEEAHPAVAKVTGVKCNNIMLQLFSGMFTLGGVLSKDRRKVTFWGFSRELDSFNWMSRKDFIVFRETYCDPVHAIPNHYKLQPDYQGKFLWISGPPGLGKSTTGQMLGKIAGYVYYEADAFMSMVNPYIPLNVKEPSMA